MTAKTEKRLEIVFYTEGLEFDEKKAVEGPLGGSETCVGLLAKALNERGHKVRVFCNTDKPGVTDGKKDGVMYAHFSLWGKMCEVLRPDVLIVSRHLQGLNTRTWPETGLTYLWMHDIMHLDYERALFAVMTQIDRIVVPTEYHLAQARHVSKGLADFEAEARRQGKELFSVIRHGVQNEAHAVGKTGWANADKVEHRRLLYVSRPERGLMTAIDALELMNKDRVGEDRYKLTVCGYKVPQELMDGNGIALERAVMRRASENPDVELLGPLPRKAMYELMGTSQALLYPTDFAEVACIAVMEAQACGLPVVTTHDYALTETCPSAAFIGKGEGLDWQLKFPDDKDYLDAVVQTVLSLEKIRLRTAVKNSQFKDMEQYLWEERAAEWEAQIMADFTQRVESQTLGVARGLYHNSDLIACKTLLEQAEANPPHGLNPEAAALLAKVTKEIAFLETEQTYAEHYLNTGEEDPEAHGVKSRRENYRFNAITSLLKDVIHADYPGGSKLPENFSLLDWGCATGGLCQRVHDEIPTARITGYDLSLKVLERARKLAVENHGADHGIRFVDQLETCSACQYDAIVIGEVLEHVRDPKQFLDDQVLPRLKKGGWIFITVPHGAWEADSFKKDDRRFHVRRFMNLDIEDLMSEMSDEGYSECGYSGNGREMNALAWLVVGFPWNGKRAPAFDYERHILTTRPRQTVSACIIVKDRPWELGRVLENVRPWVEQLIVCDTGSKQPETKEVAQLYADLVIGGPNPIEHGFDAARNRSIEPATGDWILWIDSDEWLSTPQNLRKYIRGNYFAAYVMLQRHLSQDNAHEEPDTPARLFRRDAPIKFYGMIHEQAEFGIDKPIAPACTVMDCDILHTGYYNEQQRRGRFTRNLPILIKDKAANPGRLLTDCLLVRDYCQFGVFEINAGRKGIGVHHLRKAIEIYRDKFMKPGPEGKYFTHAFRYYQIALRTLGEGIGVAFAAFAQAFAIDERRMLDYDISNLVFGTPEEAQSYLEAITKPMLAEANRRRVGEPLYHLRTSRGGPAQEPVEGTGLKRAPERGDQPDDGDDPRGEHRGLQHVGPGEDRK